MKHFKQICTNIRTTFAACDKSVSYPSITIELTRLQRIVTISADSFQHLAMTASYSEV